MYYRAHKALAEYSTIKTEKRLVGQLLDEEREEWGCAGELVILDRLTLCLVRLGRGVEANRAATEYFAKYRPDTELVGSESIWKRVAKAVRSGGPALRTAAMNRAEELFKSRVFADDRECPAWKAVHDVLVRY